MNAPPLRYTNTHRFCFLANKAKFFHVGMYSIDRRAVFDKIFFFSADMKNSRSSV